MFLAIGNAFASLAATAAALDHVVVRGRRGAGPPRLRSTTPASDRPAGQDRCERQLRQRQHLGTTRDITYIGSASRASMTLRSTSPRIRSARSRATSSPTAASYYRSDQFNFAKIGVPAFYFNSGTDFVGRPPDGARSSRRVHRARLPPAERRAHAPTGTSTAWSRTRSSAFYAGLIVANADELPEWNPGDEFEAARRAALEAGGAR